MTEVLIYDKVSTVHSTITAVGGGGGCMVRMSSGTDGSSGCSILYLLQTARSEAFSNKITGRPKMEINFYLHISARAVRCEVSSRTSAVVFHSASCCCCLVLKHRSPSLPCGQAFTYITIIEYCTHIMHYNIHNKYKHSWTMQNEW